MENKRVLISIVFISIFFANCEKLDVNDTIPSGLWESSSKSLIINISENKATFREIKSGWFLTAQNRGLISIGDTKIYNITKTEGGWSAQDLWIEYENNQIIGSFFLETFITISDDNETIYLESSGYSPFTSKYFSGSYSYIKL